MLNREHKFFLLNLARLAIKAYITDTQIKVTKPDDQIYKEKKGLFITLNIDEELRGCIGYIKPYYSLYKSVKELAVSAAFKDPRFPPLTEEEFELIDIEISVLSELIPVSTDKLDEIEIGRDGIYIVGTYGSGLLLPQVAVENNWDKITFLKNLCHKAGIPPKSYLSGLYNLYRFSAEVFSEKMLKTVDKQTS